MLRKHEKYRIWLTPGGHIELEDDPNESAIREAKEEAGLDITLIEPSFYESYEDDDSKDLIPPFFVNRHRINDTPEHVDNMFIATSKTDLINPEDGESRSGFLWLTCEEVLSHPNISKRMKRLSVIALNVVEEKKSNKVPFTN